MLISNLFWAETYKLIYYQNSANKLANTQLKNISKEQKWVVTGCIMTLNSQRAGKYEQKRKPSGNSQLQRLKERPILSILAAAVRIILTYQQGGNNDFNH